MGYEVRFQSTRRFSNLSELNKATSNKFYNEITEAALAQGMNTQLGITRDIIKGLATEGHFSIDCPSLRAEFEKKETRKQKTVITSKPAKAEFVKKEIRKQETAVTSRPAKRDKLQAQYSAFSQPQKSSSKNRPQRKSYKKYRNSNGSGAWGCLCMILSFIYTLFTCPWRFPKDAGTMGKIWHIIKVILKIAAILVILALILAAYIIISSIVNDSH